MARPDPSEFTVRPADEADWPWLLGRHSESIRDSLPPRRRADGDLDRIRRQAQEQWNQLRQRPERTDLAFVAEDGSGVRAGFVWVEATRSGFTGEPLAIVREVWVEVSHRRRGLGRLLMEAAERWARDRGLGRILLNVAEHNHVARRLYGALGYATEAHRMSKDLVDRES